MIIYNLPSTTGIYTTKLKEFSSYSDYQCDNIFKDSTTACFCRVQNASALYYNSMFFSINTFLYTYDNLFSHAFARGYQSTPFSGMTYCALCACSPSYCNAYVLNNEPFKFLKYNDGDNFRIDIQLCIDSMSSSEHMYCSTGSRCGIYNNCLVLGNQIVYHKWARYCGCFLYNCSIVCCCIETPIMTLCRSGGVNTIYINDVNQNCDKIVFKPIATYGGDGGCWLYIVCGTFYPKKIEIKSGNVKYINAWDI